MLPNHPGYPFRCTLHISWQEPEEELIILLLMKISDRDRNVKGKNVSCVKLIVIFVKAFFVKEKICLLSDSTRNALYISLNKNSDLSLSCGLSSGCHLHPLLRNLQKKTNHMQEQKT